MYLPAQEFVHTLHFIKKFVEAKVSMMSHVCEIRFEISQCGHGCGGCHMLTFRWKAQLFILIYAGMACNATVGMVDVLLVQVGMCNSGSLMGKGGILCSVKREEWDLCVVCM